MKESRIIKKITYKHQCFKNNFSTYDIEFYDDGLICYEERDKKYPESDVFIEIPKWLWSRIFKLKDTKRDLRIMIEKMRKINLDDLKKLIKKEN